MYQTISFLDFCDGFRQCGRQDQFSYEGLEALFSYLEEIEEYTGESIEFDPIALCCEFSEYDNAKEAAEECGWKYETEVEEGDGTDTEDCEEEAKEALEWLSERTGVIECSNGHVIIEDF